MIFHKLDLSFILFPQEIFLLSTSGIRRPCRKSHCGIVVHGIYTIRQNLFEPAEVHGVCVAIQPKNVVGIDRPNRLLHSTVKLLKACVTRVCGFVHWIVTDSQSRCQYVSSPAACLLMQSSYPAIYGDSQQGIHKCIVAIEVPTYPCVVAIVLCKLDPKVDSSILQISILPKQSSMDTGVAMPAYPTSVQT
jgi:hypothetical protein